MSQENIYPAESSDVRQIENKVILLYFIDKMDIPMSCGRIEEFIVNAEELMSFSTLRQYLKEMVDIGYLDQIWDNNTARYTVTDEGILALESFIKSIPAGIKTRIIKYAAENRRTVKQDFEISAFHYYDHDYNEYNVECNICEDELMLMELRLKVVSKDQALTICNNWRKGVSGIYAQILEILLAKQEPDKETLNDIEGMDD